MVFDDKISNQSLFRKLHNLRESRSCESYTRPTVVNKYTSIFESVLLCVLFKDRLLRRDLSRSVFAKQCAIRIDKQQKERYNNVVIDNDVII